MEHPIPESLGNDDLVLPAGIVCDSCNQYFGTKLEADVLRLAPFSAARVAQAVKSKSGKLPRITLSNNLWVESTGYWDQVFVGTNAAPSAALNFLENSPVLNSDGVSPPQLVRFLLKMGLELLAMADYGLAYSAKLDAARECARYGNQSHRWDFAEGTYPNREHLILSTRTDQIGPLETRQLYTYGLGIMESGDIVFSFMYWTKCFAVNLSRPSNLEYILAFNMQNTFTMRSRWSAWESQKRGLKLPFAMTT